MTEWQSIDDRPYASNTTKWCGDDVMVEEMPQGMFLSRREDARDYVLIRSPVDANLVIASLQRLLHAQHAEEVSMSREPYMDPLEIENRILKAKLARAVTVIELAQKIIRHYAPKVPPVWEKEAQSVIDQERKGG